MEAKWNPLAASARIHNPKHSGSPFDVTHFHCSYSADSPIRASVFTSSVRPEPALHATFTAHSRTVTGVLDTGSDRSMIARHLVADEMIQQCSAVVHGVGGRNLTPVGCADVTVVLHGVTLEIANCLVLDSATAVADLTVGCDVLERHGLCLDLTRRSVTG